MDFSYCIVSILISGTNFFTFILVLCIVYDKAAKKLTQSLLFPRCRAWLILALFTSFNLFFSLSHRPAQAITITNLKPYCIHLSTFDAQGPIAVSSVFSVHDGMYLMQFSNLKSRKGYVCIMYDIYDVEVSHRYQYLFHF